MSKGVQRKGKKQVAGKAAGAVVRLEEVQQALVEVRGQKGLLDSTVASLYGVETRRINEAVRNNPDKFPAGYVVQLTSEEWEGMKPQWMISEKFQGKRGDNQKSKISTSEKTRGFPAVLAEEGGKHWEKNPKFGGKVKLPAVFTEKGLYMLATILHGERAVATTIAIVETFAKIRELARTMSELADAKEAFAQRSLMQKSGDILADVLGEDMTKTEDETTFELNFAVLKFKHTVRRTRGEKGKGRDTTGGETQEDVP